MGACLLNDQQHEVPLVQRPTPELCDLVQKVMYRKDISTIQEHESVHTGHHDCHTVRLGFRLNGEGIIVGMKTGGWMIFR